jgi:hypothetical protein
MKPKSNKFVNFSKNKLINNISNNNKRVIKIKNNKWLKAILFRTLYNKINYLLIKIISKKKISLFTKLRLLIFREICINLMDKIGR